MKCEVRQVGDITVFAIQGTISFNRMEVAREFIFGEIARSPTNKFIIDIGGVETIDSSGFGFIIAIYKAVVSRKGAFAVCRPNDPVNGEMRAFGLDRIFKIYASEEEAIDAVKDAPVHRWMGEMYLHWNDSYSVGIKAFDAEHKILFGLIKRLHDGIKENEEDKIIEDALGGLVTYIQLHFKFEEQVLRENDYPAYPSHKAEHDAFADRVGDYHRRLQTDGAVHSVEVLGFMVDWLEKHLNGTDKLYTEFLWEKGIE